MGCVVNGPGESKHANIEYLRELRGSQSSGLRYGRLMTTLRR
jgi:4-hydroxy-3-methylbut-2-en-1-yl diphosphate synthase IspG/GcpE